jgi:hypothetical protein
VTVHDLGEVLDEPPTPSASTTATSFADFHQQYLERVVDRDGRAHREPRVTGDCASVGRDREKLVERDPTFLTARSVA